ncbi:MAG: hypothetical protein PHW34_15220 [Hespellia sp.]|nr:hypothetical protein [Hespellia sp.]
MGNQIDWKDPAVELPKESGDYIAIILSFKGKANVGTYSFSARHNAFNCYDNDAIPKHKIDVLAWAEQPDTPEWVKEDV